MSDEVKSAPEETAEATPAAKGPQKKLNPQQQREQERMQEFMRKLNADADRMYRQLQDRFLDYFMASENPEGEATQQKIKQLSSQWKIYCMSKNLRPDIHDQIKKYCDKIVEEFKQGMV